MLSIKERLRKWLGIWYLENRVLDHEGSLMQHETYFSSQANENLSLSEAHERLKNMYDSTRLRIDNIETRLTEAQNRARNLATKTLGKIAVIEDAQKQKCGRPAKKSTTQTKGN